MELPSLEQVKAVQKGYLEIVEELQDASWKHPGCEVYREEMLLAAEGICLTAEFSAKLAGYEIKHVTDAAKWVNRYSEMWLQKNKPSELRHITDMFRYYEAI